MATDDDKGKGDDKGAGDDNEAQWQALEERVKKSTRATLDEWWAERVTEAKKSGGGIELDFGPIGRVLGFGTKPAKKD